MIQNGAASLIKVRVRGIYSTALTTLLLDGSYQVVQPSAMQETRFDLKRIGRPMTWTYTIDETAKASICWGRRTPLTRSMICCDVDSQTWFCGGGVWL